MKHIITGLTLSLWTFSALFAQEQKTYPEQEPMGPKMTEYWTPQPKVVTPGDILTNTAPSDAIVLFDGKNLSQWTNGKGGDAGWRVHDGIVTVDKSKGDIVTRQSFGSFQLHLEWCVPQGITGSSQGRGNSGVFLQDRYEVQILDNYQNETYVNGYVGAIYKQTPPMANPMRKPGEWNVYDIIYTAPVFKEDGSFLYHPYVTVILNGVLVQSHTEIWGTTEYIGLPKVKPHGDGPLRLQAHGDKSEPISFRNIWVRPLK